MVEIMRLFSLASQVANHLQQDIDLENKSAVEIFEEACNIAAFEVSLDNADSEETKSTQIPVAEIDNTRVAFEVTNDRYSLLAGGDDFIDILDKPVYVWTDKQPGNDDNQD